MSYPEECFIFRINHILLLFGGMSYICMSVSSNWTTCCSSAAFPYWNSVWVSIHYWKWGAEISYCVAVYFSFQFCQRLLHIFRHTEIWYVKFIILIFSWWFFFVNIYVPVCLFGLFFILSLFCLIYSTATPALFWLLFPWNIFFYPFTFSLNVSSDLSWVSCKTRYS